MPTPPQIIQLRQAGQINEAYTACRELLQAFPTDWQVREQMMWCLKAQCEKAAQSRNPQLFLEMYRQLPELRLHEIGLTNAPNRFAWDIKKLFDGLVIMPQQLVDTADALFATMRELQFFKPTKYYSLLADSFLKVKGPKNAPWAAFTDFMDWFGFDNLTGEDYNPIPLANGKTMMSLAERLHNAYFKALKAKIEAGFTDMEAIERFIVRLTRLNEDHPEYRYSLYQKGQLLLALGRKEEAQQAIIPFVKRHQNDFWVWDLLGDSVDDLPLRLSCYCRGLCCPTDASFLGKLRLKTASLMHQTGHDANAKKELLNIQEVYQTQGWSIPREAIDMMNLPWCLEVAATESNKEFYEEHLPLSEEFLFTDVPERSILITYVNRERKICNFIDEQRRRGFFSFQRQRMRFKENTIFKVRFDGDVVANQMSRFLTIKPVTDNTPYIGIFFKKIEGELRIQQGRSFGFVRDIYVEERLITRNHLSDGNEVVGTAVLSYERRRDRFGWKAVKVTPQS